MGSIYYQKVKHSNELLLSYFTNVSQLYCLFVCYEHYDLGNWKCYVLLTFLTYLQCCV